MADMKAFLTKDRGGPRWSLVLVLLGLGFALAGAAIWIRGSHTERTFSDVAYTTGMVVEVRTHRQSAGNRTQVVDQPLVQYQVTDGSTHRFWSRGTPGITPEIGSKVELEYDRNNPRTVRGSRESGPAMTDSWDLKVGRWLVFGGLPVAALGLGAGMLWGFFSGSSRVTPGRRAASSPRYHAGPHG